MQELARKALAIERFISEVPAAEPDARRRRRHRGGLTGAGWRVARAAAKSPRMRTDTPQPIRLADYTPPDFLVDEVHLDFDLAPSRHAGEGAGWRSAATASTSGR